MTITGEYSFGVAVDPEGPGFTIYQGDAAIGLYRDWLAGVLESA